MRTTLSILCIVLATAAAFAQPPTSVKAFPVCPGARLVRSVDEGAASTVEYEVGGAAGAVVAYYLNAFGIRPEGSEPELIPLAIWTEASVQCMVYFEEARTPTFPWAQGAATGALLQWESEDGCGNQSAFNLSITRAGGEATATQISLTAITVNPEKLRADLTLLATRAEEAASAMVAGLASVNPAQERIINDLRETPPTAAELRELVRSLYGVPLYPGATLQLRAMEIYAMELWGGLEGYWFLTKDLPDKVVAYYERVTGNHAFQKALDLAFYIDISDAARQVTGHIAIYQGTTALHLSQEPGEADPEEVWNVSTIGFYRDGEPVEPEASTPSGP